ncbi:DUF362 domain-containing protein [Thermoanaerobacterium sp. RBIITD]|uniref:DUF362 domain-containing protein n=1 Tax=Thermoanaerobacterium sp. RBIITD TaxID=1550240 RepID=UPI001E4E2DF1|nr:DUF362 domain-containing protein [Thermoanaerobacterium sp. RBIITD]
MYILSIVSIERCRTYSSTEVKSAINKCINNLGGIDKYVKKSDKVFLKANLLKKNKPDDAVTTHPAIVEAVANIVKDIGAIPIIGDSPSGPFSERALKGIYESTGMEEVSKRTGAELNFITDELSVKIPGGKVIKQATIMKAIMDCDLIISIPKLKTHGMTVYTGAVKNQFGVIPGLVKAGYHLTMSNIKDFADMLIDLNNFLRPVLTFMDAVVGMEGNGPSAGKPKDIGLIIASNDVFSLDTVATSIIGLKPEDVPTVFMAQKRGYGKLEDIDIKGLSINDAKVSDFDIPTLRGFSVTEKIPPFLSKYIDKYVKPYPEFNHEICKSCGICVSSCPPKALKMINRKPLVDLKTCIRCFCCQELCPHKAVKIKRPYLSKFLYR